MVEKIKVLVLSCDNYVDMHPDFYRSFKLNWEGDNELYFVTESKRDPNPELKYIHTGNKSSNWGYMVLNALKQIENNDDYILTTFDDLLLNKEFPSKWIDKYESEILKLKCDSLKIYPRPKGVKYSEFYNILPNKYPYRFTCVYTYWKISSLKELINSKMSPWEFEQQSEKTSNSQINLVVKNNGVNFINAIVKGKKTIDYIRLENKRNSISTREKMNYYEINKRHLRIILFKIKQKILHGLYICRTR